MHAISNVLPTGYQKFVETVSREVIKGKEAHIYPFEPAFESPQEGVSELRGHDVIMLTSNNYLGLATHPEIIKAMKQALDVFGTGTCGARLHNGTTKLHVELEERLAEFMGTEKSVAFSSGFMANLGTLSVLGQKGAVIITDQLNHMSIVDGYRLADCDIKIFTHNDMEKLRYILERSQDYDRRLIVVDGVYSMDGDLVPLDQLVSLSDTYDAMVMVDEAHSFGFFGEKGRGVVEHFELEEHVHIRMGTCSKSLAAVGGFIAANRDLCEYIKHTANAYIFNASLPPAICGGILKGLEILETESWRRDILWENTRRFRKGLLDMGINCGESISPVIPIFIGDDLLTMKLSNTLLERGVYIATTIFPAVPKNTARFRTTITSALSEKQIDQALGIMFRTFKEFGVI